MSVRHIVMWRIKGNNADERLCNAQRVREAFESMRGRIPGLRYLEIGLDVSGVEYACDMVLVSEFDDSVALAAYASHPAHLEARTSVGDLRTERYQVDYISPV